MSDVIATNQTILVVGGGISGVTAAIEAAECGKQVILIEKNPSLGGRVSQLYKYFPKLCFPSCGMEINLRRMKANRNLNILTMTEVSAVSGESGNYSVTLKTRPPRRLAEAIVFTTFPEVGTPEDGAAFQRVSRGARLTRYGMDCYAYALVAAGQVALVIEAGLNPYDIHAPIAVIKAAGGIVTDWTGGPAHQGGRVIAAANPSVHAAALDILQAALND